jgi:voltage-gated potassium channel
MAFGRRRRRRAGGQVSATLSARHVRYWLVAVAVVLVVGALGYVALLGWTWSDAFYMTVITLTTVGYKEVRELDDVGRAWTMLVSLSSIGIIFGTVGIIAEYLLGEQLSGRQERRRMEQELRALRGHVVLCGYGRVGSTVARDLADDGGDVVVVDTRQESLEQARHDGFRVVEGDATDDRTLREAGVDRARALIATTDSDANNVYVTLSARAMNEGLMIVARANAPGADAKLERAGANQIVSPYRMAGRRIAALATRPRVTEFLDAALSRRGLEFSLDELVVEPGGQLDGRTVGELREEGVHVLAIAREGGYEAHPDESRRLAASEELVVSGTAEALRRLRRTPGVRPEESDRQDDASDR